MFSMTGEKRWHLLTSKTYIPLTVFHGDEAWTITEDFCLPTKGTIQDIIYSLHTLNAILLYFPKLLMDSHVTT